jgi:hypothetical protein
MATKKVQEKFESHLAALELVVMYLHQSVSLLLRSIEGKLPIKNKKDSDLLRLALTHYIVNNLNALFDDKGKNVNSLSKIAKRFENNLPKDFFFEYLISIEKLRKEFAADLERIKKNRDQSTAHLGADEYEQLGWAPRVAKNMDELLGTRSSVAQKKSLEFITPYQIYVMPIIQALPKIKNTLEELRMKFWGR